MGIQDNGQRMLELGLNHETLKSRGLFFQGLLQLLRDGWIGEEIRAAKPLSATAECYIREARRW